MQPTVHNMNVETSTHSVPARSALFALGFRPFFLLAAFIALTALGVWGFGQALGWVPVAHYPGVLWHSHEMLFGYAVAVIAGFLLTAVRNWTGMQTPVGAGLAGLVLLWLAGRVLALMPAAVPGSLIAAVDLAFLPALAASLAIPVLRARQWHNLVFIVILGALTFANALVHLAALGLAPTGRLGTYGALYMVIAVITVIGGRVIPFFTESALPGAVAARRAPLEWLVFLSLGAFVLVDLTLPMSSAAGVLAAVAGTIHVLRLAGWHDRRVWSVPLLWVLFLGYGWVGLGFILYALAAAGLMSPTLAVHAWTAGGIGVLTVGMMARVALGHTGRPLRPVSLTVAAFVLVNLAAAVRVLLPILWPGAYAEFIAASTALWVAGFLAFLIVYAPILWRPRVDGRPG